MAQQPDKDQQDPKKAFPGSFLIFLLVSILLISMAQNFMSLRQGDVSFSYQLEHLVNLGLIEPEESTKIALNDNLVTFSGRFREDPTDEGTERYKYLSELSDSHNLADRQDEIVGDMDRLRENILDSADFFYHLTGTKLPSRGVTIVSNLYNSVDRDNEIVLTDLSNRSVVSLRDLERELSQVDGDASSDKIKTLGRSTAVMVRQFRSPLLGIGSESLKVQLTNLDEKVIQANVADVQDESSLAIYTAAVKELRQVADAIGQEENGLLLTSLRPVRDYREAIETYGLLTAEREKNRAQLERSRDHVADTIWFFNNRELSTRALEQEEREHYNPWYQKAKEAWESFPDNRGTIFTAPDQPLTVVLEKTFKSQQPAPNYFSMLLTVAPVIIVVLVLYFIFSRQMKGMGGGAMNFGKSPAKMMKEGEQTVTFADVAGAEEAIEELHEIVDFLKNPDKVTALGGRIPKGVLCVGPPGTGKTLIARAVAGEANRPFFSISGSDFVEMFVGVGASRVRDLFEQAKKNAPCIIFMDEIDAVGRHRGGGVGGGHDEREQTLNQLLVEMDGFDTNEGIILMAATNRPDVLDKALLRPGRFDRMVTLDLPDIKGRYQILKVHARKIKLDKDVDLMSVARGTPGASGADLANILNEAALLAARLGRTAVTNAETREARDKVLFGKERRSLELDEQEKLTTAYHESGHAVVGLVVKHCDTVDKVTIIPRGQSLGATHFLPKKNRVSYWKSELLDQLAVLMGGRVAEEIFLEDFSSGAQQDIKQATELARNMVCQWGMSDLLGLVAYSERSESGQYLGLSQTTTKNYSEKTAQLIDQEVRRFLDDAHEYATKILKEKREEVELMTKMLMEFETLDRDDVKKIVLHQTWDADEKKKKVEEQKEAHKAPTPPTPPPKPLTDGENPLPVTA